MTRQSGRERIGIGAACAGILPACPARLALAGEALLLSCPWTLPPRDAASGQGDTTAPSAAGRQL